MNQYPIHITHSSFIIQISLCKCKDQSAINEIYQQSNTALYQLSAHCITRQMEVSSLYKRRVVKQQKLPLWLLPHNPLSLQTSHQLITISLLIKRGPMCDNEIRASSNTSNLQMQTMRPNPATTQTQHTTRSAEEQSPNNFIVRKPRSNFNK